jgi:hypothetical protein
VWGCASAVAVLRLKPWGRISFIVYGGLLVAFGALDAVGSMMSGVILASMPQNADLPQGVLAVTMGVMVGISLAMAAIGVWWLIMFNRVAVKSAFATVGDVTRELARIPVRVAVVAWFLVGSIVLSAPVLLLTRPKIPAVMLGMAMHGWPAFLVLALQYSLTVIAGVGLLRKWSQAHALTIGLFVFGVINVGAMALRPGGLRGVLEMYQSNASPGRLPPEFFGSMTTVLMMSGVVFNLVLMALLISARRRYLEACAAAGSTSS